MVLDKFYKTEFGNITTITSDATGIVMFIGKEVCDIWGHSNVTQAIKDARLNENEFKVIELKKFRDFKNQLTKQNLVGYRTSSITLLTESGMYKLALSSSLERATPFKNWITEEILPSIRKKGYYSIANQSKELMIHSNINIQKNNSKEINAKNYIERGLESVIDYNRKNCIIHTGKTPHEIKEQGKLLGLKSVERTSAKEVLRHTKPELACSMSFVDSLVSQGYDLNTVSELSLKCAVPLFQGMIELGITPAELKK